MADPGSFIISLDLELYWGVRDTRSLASYRENLLGVRRAVPAMLEAFRSYNMRCTWAAVGFLLFDRKSDLLDHVPSVLPDYERPELSPYPYLATIGANEKEDPFHYGRTLVQQIVDTPGMELATHTFSHYYCLERGQTSEAFEADLRASLEASQTLGPTPRSIVFPRNQYDAAAIATCEKVGIRAYRGTERAWAYTSSSDEDDTSARRAFRLLDTYAPLTGATLFTPADVDADGDAMMNVPATRFLRPYAPRYRHADALKLRRICGTMTGAAKTGRGFHLWWHPHNFGRDLPTNMAMLTSILDHYRYLQDTYGMQSISMGDAIRPAATRR